MTYQHPGKRRQHKTCVYEHTHTQMEHELHMFILPHQSGCQVEKQYSATLTRQLVLHSTPREFDPLPNSQSLPLIPTLLRSN
jgi:hypothetical protein